MPTNYPSDLAEALVESLADAVIFADRAGLIQRWNPGAQAVFGYSEDEVLGHSLDVIIPERLRPSHWDGFHTAIESGTMKHGRDSMTTKSIHKDGRDLYLDLSFALVKDGSGQVLGAVAVARDITARFQAERESRRRIAELEEQVKTARPPDRRPPPGSAPRSATR
jgi:PAS domain S-box-containing protein